MGESSTHFTLHETMTTSQSRSRPATEDSLARRVQAGSAAAAGAKNSNEGQSVHKSSSTKLKKMCANSADDDVTNERAEVVTTHHQATVESTVQHKNTGAIPKKKAKLASTGNAAKNAKSTNSNHLDEILALPIDDSTTTPHPPANGKTVPS